MSKYIDAEKLTKFEETLADIIVSSQGLCTYEACKDVAKSEAPFLIASLQQEQPEGLHFTPLNRLIQKIPSKSWNDTVNNYAKKLRDCLIKEGYRKDAEVLQGYISYMNGNNVPMATMDEHEQPEVDLDAEIAIYLNRNVLNRINNSDIIEDFTTMEAGELARHFWNKGFYARKEE